MLGYNYSNLVELEDNIFDCEDVINLRNNEQNGLYFGSHIYENLLEAAISSTDVLTSVVTSLL